MRILDRYILKTTLQVFITCLLTFFFLYVIVDIFSHLDEILKQHIDLVLLGQYYLSYLPIIFVQITPMACLLAVLYTFGKLNRDNEIIAMRASGLSVPQISSTVIVFGFVLSLFVFWVNDRYVPVSLYLNQKIKDQMESGVKKPKAKESEVIENLSMFGLKNRLFFINKFYPAQNRLEGIVILEHDESQNITRKVVANRGEYTDGAWRFYQNITYDFDETGQIKGEPQYAEEEIMAIPESPRDFLNQRQRPDFMDISQLSNYIWKLSKSGAITVIRNLKIELYQRFVSPFTSMIILLLGIPFSLMMKRRAAGLSSIGVSILVGFFYYVLNAVCIALGKAGLVLPSLSVLLAPAVALVFILQFIKKLP